MAKVIKACRMVLKMLNLPRRLKIQQHIRGSSLGHVILEKQPEKSYYAK